MMNCKNVKGYIENHVEDSNAIVQWGGGCKVRIR